HLAIDAGVPIVPISVSGSRRITPKGSIRIERGRVKIHYGEQIPTRGLSPDDRNELKAQVRDAILAGLDPGLPTPESATTGWFRGRRARTLPESRGPGG